MSAAGQLRIEPPAPANVGVVEVVGQLSPSELFMSGWAHQRPAPGAPVLVLLEDRAIQAQFWSTWSDRPDVGPLAGFSGILECAFPLQAADLRGIQLGGNRVMSLYEGRTLVDEHQSIGLLRSSLKTTTDEADASLLSAAGRFDGTDTISTSPLPIRVGIDDCVALPGNSILISGWLYDPEDLVETVWLAGKTSRRRLDDLWIRRPRPDVATFLAEQPRFALHATEGHKSGFTALLSGLAGDIHLTIKTTSSGELHLPLSPRPGSPLPLLRGFLRSIDPDLPSSLDLIDHHVAPVLAALAPTRPAPISQSHEGLDDGAPCSIVIGCSRDSDNVAALLAILAVDPAARTTPILVIASPGELAASGGEIERAALFYGLSLNIVSGEAIADHVDALHLGALVSHAETLCLLAADRVPATTDWFTRLIAAQRSTNADLLLPLHFDGAQFGTQPAQRERSSLVPDIGCSILPRAAFLTAATLPPPYLHDASKSRAILHALEIAGLARAQATDIDILRIAPTDPSDLLAQRADRQADALRAALLP